MNGSFDFECLLGTWFLWGGGLCAVAYAVVFEMATRHRLSGVGMTEANDYILGNSSIFRTRGSPSHFDERGLMLLKRAGQIKAVYLVGIPIDYIILAMRSWLGSA